MKDASPTSKKLNLFDSAMIIMGSMIGSGIFIVSADIARSVHTPGMLLAVWLLTAVITLMGALSYGELSAMMPKAGGQYIYLKEAFNPLFGFLYGWTLFTVIQTGTIAAVGVAFAKFSGVLFPFINDEPLGFSIGTFAITNQRIIGILAVWLLTILNLRGVKSGAMIQNIFTVTKVGALLLVILAGFGLGMSGNGNVQNFQPLFPSEWEWGMVGIFAAAMVGSLFSSDAWNNITFTAGEIQKPQRNIPLSLLIGTGVVSLLYILANVIYIYVLGMEGIAGAKSDRVGTALLENLLGSGGELVMTGLILISTFGCLNGMILSGARVYYAMAKDGYFLKPAEKLNANQVPSNALFLQAIWASLLTLSGKYGDLLDYVIFAVLIFYILTVAGLIRLRITQPDRERPYKVIGYPFVPVLYIVLATFICVFLLVMKPEFSFAGLGIVLLGVPVYFWTKRKLN
jgi:APA family basic amino acid/polyamine antiporter